MRVFKKALEVFILFVGCSFMTLQAEEIHELVKKKDLVEIKKLVKENPQVIHAIDENGRTALHWACRLNELDIITFLIKHHSDVNKPDQNRIVPLHSAAARGNVEACQLLLNNKAQIDKTNSYGSTPLHFAVSYGQFEAVKFLVEKGAPLEMKDGRQRTPLSVAAREMAGIEIVRYLVETGANVNTRDYSNSTPISLAAWRGSEDIVDYLLSQNAELDLSGRKGIQLLHYSINEKLWKLYQEMVKKCDHLNELIPEGQTLLHWASKSGFLQVIRDLVDRGADLNEPDVFGYTSLHYAARSGRINTVKFLVDEGADIHARLKTEESPVNLAEWGNHEAVVDFLLERGADPQKRITTRIKGAYFGQKAPEEEPQLFAAGIVNNIVGGHSNVSFSPDGDMAAWTEWIESEEGYSGGITLWFSRIEDGYWLQPVVLEKFGDVPFFSPDGKRLYYLAENEIRYYEIEGNSLLEKPKKVALDCGQIGLYWQFSLDKDKNLYFGGTNGLCRAVFENGEYTKIEKISDVLHPDYRGGSPYMAPDKSYYIFSSKDYSDSKGQFDLYIGFRKSDGTWSRPVNMGSAVNSATNDNLPFVSVDGKYLFYKSDKDEQPRIYWISARIIQKLKKENI
ncbi:MAG: ankyrin repeat domain-containing protein [Candidatus Aminicenantes bacterium]|nr:ankyrin repeat domain-containing protein [Candidatus Aminicenantes bacterium]